MEVEIKGWKKTEHSKFKNSNVFTNSKTQKIIGLVLGLQAQVVQPILKYAKSESKKKVADIFDPRIKIF